MKQFPRFSALAIGLSMSSALMLAHHGTQSAYQVDKMITLNGTVTEWVFAYPHPEIYFDVKRENGTVQHWTAELIPSPVMLKNMKAGWSKESLKPGDQITIVGNPSKVSLASVMLGRKLTVNGKEMPLGSAAPGNEDGVKPSGKE